jgi:hypothetical protein
MSRLAKLLLVLAGYLAAVVAGGAAGYLYDRRVSALPYDTSGGMYAGGEAITSLGVFLLVALVPTLLGLWFLRRHEKSWTVLGIAALGFAGAGLLSVLLPPGIRPGWAGIPLLLAELMRVAHLLGAPLWIVSFGLFALLAPFRAPRRRLVLATALELVAGVLVLVHWFLPGAPF